MDAQQLKKSFYSLTPERILDAVEFGGRRATGYVLALNSMENRVYDVELEDEEHLVAKFYRPGRWSREAILEEHAFLAELVAAEVPVVAPIDLGDGKGTLASYEVDGASIWYAVFPKVRGRIVDELDDERYAQIGRLLARLHNVGGQRRALHRPVLSPETYGRRSVDVLLAFGVPIEIERRFVELTDELLSTCDALFSTGERIRLHGDCHAANLLWGSEGPFFLDFDDFLVGPPVQDLWLLAGGNDDSARVQREQMVCGYESMREFDRYSLRLIEPLRTLRILRYAAWVADRRDDPAFTRAFPDFGERVWWQREVTALEEQRARLSALVDNSPQ